MKKTALTLLTLTLSLTIMESCQSNQEQVAEQPKVVEADTINYLEEGLKYAMGTKAILGKNLMGTIQAKGTDGAVEFCNVNALPLTDSMSVVFNAKIKRVSDQPRNPLNEANAEELAFIEELKLKIAKGEELTPKLIEHDDKMIGYYAIETIGMCLQCHGTVGTSIQSSTVAIINEKYPSDKATGYLENQIRGIWVVEMDKK